VAAAVGSEDESPTGSPKPADQPVATSRGRITTRVRALVVAVREGDDNTVQQAVLQLSGRRRWLAPLALAVGAVAMLFTGLRLLFTNWRLTLVQVLPAMWIWLALLDLKQHAFRGKDYHFLHGTVLVLCVTAVALITAACFFLNAVFAFAIVKPGPPQIRPAFAEARAHLATVFAWGFTIGLALGVSSLFFSRWGRWWFAISMSIVIGVMMLTYVAVPSRLIGLKPNTSTRDKLAATAVGGAVGAIVCSPPYLLGRLGIVLLGSGRLFVLGVILLVVGFTLQAGVTGAVKAVKMSAKLVGGPSSAATDGAATDGAATDGAATDGTPPAAARIEATPTGDAATGDAPEAATRR